MKTHPSRLALCIATLLLGPLAAHAAAPTKAEYASAKTAISADYKAAKAACSNLKANARDICKEEAEAQQDTARAELEFRASGKPADGMKARTVKADGAYEVAKERCDDQSGNARDVCNKEAKATHVSALAAAKNAGASAEDRADARSDVNEARYKAAAEKCDTLASDAKTACVQAAKKANGQR